MSVIVAEMEPNVLDQCTIYITDWSRMDGEGLFKSSFTVKHKDSNAGIFVLLKFEINNNTA